MTHIDNEIKLALEQQRIEREARKEGATRYHKNQAKAIEREALSRTTAAQVLSATAMSDVIIGTKRLLKTAPPAAKASLQWAEKLGAEKCAFIAMTHAWNGVSKSHTTVAVRIANSIRNELNALALREGHAGLAQYVFAEIRKSRSPKHKAAVLSFARKATKTPDLKELGFTDKLLEACGLHFLNTVIECSGIFELKSVNVVEGFNCKVSLTVELQSSVLEAISAIDARAAWMSPVQPLMITEPAAWDENMAGGYLSGNMKLDLLKGASLGYIEAIDEYDLSPALKAMNALQSAALRVNKKVLDVALRVWERDWAFGILPQQEPKAKPSNPAAAAGMDVETFKAMHPAEWKAWKKKASAIAAWNASDERDTKIKDAATLLSLASEFAGRSIWSPVQMDFRTRMYYVANHLTPQGNDMAKGLLEFSRGVPMTAAGARSLAIAGATMWANGGIDKAPMDDRVQWVYDNEDLILASARDPLNNTWWAMADGGDDYKNPDKFLKGATAWTFLAFCFEWAGWVEHGEGYESHLIIYADGKCNGSQHHAALMRDTVSAEYVCMTPMDRPDDLYTRVLEKVNARLEELRFSTEPVFKKAAEDAETGPTVGELAELVCGKLKRAHVKRACMTYSYGVTLMGVRDQLKYDQKDFFEQFPKNLRKPLIALLADEILAGVKATVKASAECMRFLQDVARVVAENGVAMNWITPDGFPVQQKYEQYDEIRVRTVLSGGTRIRIDKTTSIRKAFIESAYDVAVKVLGTKAAARRFSDDMQAMLSYGVFKNIVEQYRVMIANANDSAFGDLVEATLRDVLVGDHAGLLDGLTELLMKIVVDAYTVTEGAAQTINAYLHKTNGKLDVKKQAAAMAPNFIHSLDATALRMTINACADEGIQMAAVHDSFGTNVEHYARMNVILREQFIKMYTEQDPLADLLAMAKNSIPEEQWSKLPALPQRGSLDLELVKDAAFFFA